MVTVESTPSTPTKAVSYTLLPGTPTVSLPSFVSRTSSSTKVTIFFICLVVATTIFNFLSPPDVGVSSFGMVSTSKSTSGGGEYVPADVERFVVENADALGYNNLDWNYAEGCAIWKSPAATTFENYNKLMQLRKELEDYSKAIEDFQPDIPDLNLIEELKRTKRKNWAKTCRALRPHPDGIQALFPSKQLSLLPSNNGYIEPLLPPMRHSAFCDDLSIKTIVKLDYMVHDFEAMCMSLQPTSKLVLFDLGASLKYHGSSQVPIVKILRLYEKHGFKFDHIYAFEITPFDPTEVYEQLLPEEYFASYHWINAGM